MGSKRPTKYAVGSRCGTTRRHLLRSAGALTLLQIPAWAQTQNFVSSERLQERSNLAVIGQIGHGKTTLTAAITRVLAEQGKATFVPYDQIDRAPNESAYGTPIAIARVQYESDKRRYTQADCPRHSDYIKAIITGAAAMDGAILVVSAIDGPTPETREQILLARRVGVSRLVVFLNKIDLESDPELTQLVEMEVRDLLSRYNFPAEKIPVIRGSALAALEDRDDNLGKDSILGLLRAVGNYIPQPPRLRERPFLMPIAEISSIGPRTRVTGQIERGQVTTRDEVEVVGLKITQRRTVARVEWPSGSRGSGEAGQEVHCILNEIAPNSLRTGQVLCKPGSVKSHAKFKAEAYFLTQGEGGRQAPFLANYRPQFHIRTAGVTGVVHLPQGTEMVMPGANIAMEVHLNVSIAMEEGLRFIIRDGDQIVGVGVVASIVK